jgi:pyridinium-3,5-bisthiocarboxylic acid mononucleotide nickel chelatase
MDEKILYLECYSGISGDMTVGALLDLGADQNVLIEGLNSLKVDGYKIVIGRRTRSNIDACDFDVILEHDHDHDHAEGHSHHHHDDSHSHETKENQSLAIMEEHSEDHHSHIHLGHHEHRNLFEINTIIEQSEISANAKELAKKIFHIIAVAEAKAHAKPLEEVHFHEVGAIDSIVDIVATAICLDNLGIKKVIVSELYEGTGQINCQHGLLPIPVPAVVNIAAAHQLPLHITSVKGELVTPTGAGIVAAIRTGDTLPKEMKIHKIGLGAGKRNYTGASGFLRAMLIEDISASAADQPSEDRVWVLEANIDDCTGEALALAMDLLFETGAKDVYYTPIFMKKNRPAYLLGVICCEDKVAQLEGIIFTHTTTIGIRKQEALRTVLARSQKTVPTPYGEALVKVCSYRDRTFIYPEYESIKTLCKKADIDYMTMYQYVQGEARK